MFPIIKIPKTLPTYRVGIDRQNRYCGGCRFWFNAGRTGSCMQGEKDGVVWDSTIACLEWRDRMPQDALEVMRLAYPNPGCRQGGG